MIVDIYHTLPGEARLSMDVYARELVRGLHCVDSERTLRHWRPQGPLRRAVGRFEPLARLAGYMDRYGLYQWRVWRKITQVNHIVDHGYGHLAFSFDARRTLVTFHDAVLLRMDARELPTDSRPRFTILGHKLSLRAMTRVARVIADSESSRKDLLRFTDYPADRVRVVPLGVAEHFRPPEAAREPMGQPEQVRILHVGHCGPYKNIEGILCALPIIARRLATPVLFVKVGGTFSAAQRALMHQLRVQNRVQHLGAVALSDLPTVYAQSDVLLLPSLYEGFGLTALEAMACGTPVVASTEGSLPEVVGNAGLLVHPTDTEMMAEAVVRVVSDAQLRATLRRRGMTRARTFTWERTARDTLAVYREIYEEAG